MSQSKGSSRMSIFNGHIAGASNFRPGYLKPDGTSVSASLAVNVVVNENGKATSHRLVVWDGRDAKPGKGFASTMAKALSIGKELSGTFVVETYQGPVRNKEGVALTNADGSVVEIDHHQIKAMPGELHLGPDSQKRLTLEIANFETLKAANGGQIPTPAQCGFNARPAGWLGGETTEEGKIWKAIRDYRESCVPTAGSTNFGYAKIVAVPEGCTPLLMTAGATPVADAADAGAAVGAALAEAPAEEMAGAAAM